MSTMPRIGPKSPSFSKAESANSVASGKWSLFNSLTGAFSWHNHLNPDI